MITGGAGGGPPQDVGVAGNSPNDGKACTPRGSGGALHIGQGLARDAFVAQSLCAACPHGHDHASTGKMASKQSGQFPRNIVCDPKWLLIVLVVVMIVAVVTVFQERRMEENGQRRMETMLFLHRSPRRHAMFLQHTSMDHARVQALRNSHTCSDFGFVTIAPILSRISTRSHLLLQAVLHLVHLRVQLVLHPSPTLPHQALHVFHLQFSINDQRFTSQLSNANACVGAPR